MTRSAIPVVLAGIIARVRGERPLVHSLTNSVVANWTANVCLALGASPMMSSAPEELADICRIAKALNINIGTLDASVLPVMVEAARIMGQVGRPVILDPVGVGVSDFRLKAALAILARSPRLIRANAGEIAALATAFNLREASPTARISSGAGGVDSLVTTDLVAGDACRLAARSGSIVVMTGEDDLVTDGTRMTRISGGTALMTRITGGGCALSAVVAACAAVEDDAYQAAIAACAAYKGAAALSARHATGPGSLASGLLDALSGDEAADLIANAAVGNWN